MHDHRDPDRPIDARVADLLARMTLEEKAGELFHSIASVGPGGRALTAGEGHGLPVERIDAQITADHIRHFNVLGPASPRDIAVWHNTLQEMAEQTRLGIPVTLSSDPRHGFVDNPATGSAAEAFSQWPEPPGLAATGDADLVRRHADAVRREFRAVGISVLLGPMADLASEPRWARTIGTFGADVDTVSALTLAFLDGLRGPGPASASVAAMLKHFPGAGPQKDGEDAHFPYGREQVYPGGRFEQHLRPFADALAAGVSQVMPYYGMPVGLPGVEEVGFGFNRSIVTELLRGRLGFDGIVCTDWGLVSDATIFGSPMPAKAWGVEHLDRAGRVQRILEAGCDQLGGECCPELVVELVRSGRVGEDRLDTSVRRLLREKFRLGLFDVRRVDVDAVDDTVGRPDDVAAGVAAQQRSIVVLTDDRSLLPLGTGSRVYLDGVDPAAAAARGLVVVAGPAEADVVLVRAGAPFERRTEGFENFFHAGDLDFPESFTAHLADLAARAPVVLDLFLDRPAVLTGVLDHAAALVADFGAADGAVLDVLCGRAETTGRLPFQLPSSMADVRAQREDVPDDSPHPVFARGAGLGRRGPGATDPSRDAEVGV